MGVYGVYISKGMVPGIKKKKKLGEIKNSYMGISPFYIGIDLKIYFKLSLKKLN